MREEVMNETIKRILKTAWTEPRHFFFWLALLSLLSFVTIAALSGFSGSNAALAFVVLACTFGFLIGGLCFVLAWIPPVRRWLGWVLARRFLAAACLATLIGLIYAVENWQARHAWVTYKQQREAQGVRMDMAQLAPANVPADQNMFETPLWTGLHFVRSNGMVVWNDPEWGKASPFDVFGPQGGNAPGTSGWPKSQRVDLAAWQAFYRSTNNLFASKDGPATNYFPVSPQAQTPAEDVLTALNRFTANRELLVQAAQRPEARFWVDYDAGPAMLLPHLARVKSCAQYLALHAEAALAKGDRATALEDIKLELRLIEALRKEPLLISHLVRIAALQIALQPVWEGLADRRWNESDLKFLETELGREDFLADYALAMQGEQACVLWVVDYVKKAGLKGWEQMGADMPGTDSDTAAGKDEPARWLGRTLFHLVPSGWFDKNKLSTCRMHQDYILPLVDQERHVISPGKAAATAAKFENQHWGLDTVFAKMLMPAYSRAAMRFARGQNSVDCARVACALERYRLAKGNYPEQLAALSPDFLPKVPGDVITGEPLKYRRTENGQFLLYSVGWDGKDDGGKVELTKSGTPDFNKGDWAWRYPEG
jgi:hypothetical protein